MSSKFTDPPHGLYPEDLIKWREEHEHELPPDLRDAIMSSQDSLRQPDDMSDYTGDDPNWREVGDPRSGVGQHPTGEVVQPQAAPDGGSPGVIDVEADDRGVGMQEPDVRDSRGPIGPDASQDPAYAEGEPAGQWGSSGGRGE